MEERCENDVEGLQWPVSSNVTISIATPPPPKWKWDFFGDGYTMMITTCAHIPWWKRMATKILLGSRWEKL